MKRTKNIYLVKINLENDADICYIHFRQVSESLRLVSVLFV